MDIAAWEQEMGFRRQVDAARALGINESHYSQVKSGARRLSPSLWRLMAVLLFWKRELPEDISILDKLNRELNNLSLPGERPNHLAG